MTILRPVLRLVTLPHRVTLSTLRLAFELAGGMPAVLVPVLMPALGKSKQDDGPHPFLSPSWIEAAKRIRDDYRGVGPPPPLVRVNQVVTGVPFGAGELLAHTDTSDGDVDIDLGHIDEADLTVTIDYETAKTLLVDMDVSGAMQAFMKGRIEVRGDIAKLMALQTAQVDPVALEAAARIRAITA